MAIGDPLCPFQTPLSLLIPRIKNQIVHFDLTAALWNLGLRRGELQTPCKAAKQRRVARADIQDDEVVANQTACWLLEHSNHWETLLSTSENIPSLYYIQSSRLSVRNEAFNRLLVLFRNNLAAWSAAKRYPGLTQGDFESLDDVLVHGRALCHTILGSNDARADDFLRSPARRLVWPHWKKESTRSHLANELKLIRICVEGKVTNNYCLANPERTLPFSPALPIYMAALLEPSTLTGGRGFRVEAQPLDRIILAQMLINMCLLNPEQCYSTSLNLSAWALGTFPLVYSGQARDTHVFDTMRQSWWNAYMRYV